MAGQRGCKMEIKLFSKEMCLAIAKVVRAEEKLTDDELIEYLPDSLFGKTHRVKWCAGNYEVYGEEEVDGRCSVWIVPTYFVEKAWRYATRDHSK